jgi:hypothetical protein
VQNEASANRLLDVCRLWRLHIQLLSLADCVHFAATPAEGHREGVLLRPVSLVEKLSRREYANCLSCLLTRVLSAAKVNVSLFCCDEYSTFIIQYN